MAERIDIEINDRVDVSISNKILAIANAADKADIGLNKLKASLNAINSGGLSNLQQQISLAASATSALVAAQNQLNTSHQTLSNSINKTAAAQQSLNAANQAAITAQQNTNTAVNQGVVNQNQLGASISNSTGYIEKMIVRMAVMFAIYESFRGIKLLTDMGFEYNKTIESSRIGIASLIVAEGEFTDVLGRKIDGIDKVNASLMVSDDIINKLKKDNLSTAATFEQLLKGFQTAVAPGLQVGLNLDQIEKYSVSMVKAATAMRLPLDQMAEEMRSMLTGNISARNSIIATRLGITPDQIRQLQGDSQALFSFIMSKLKAFDDFGALTQNSFEGIMSNFKDKLSEALGIGTEPFFNEFKKYIQSLYDSIVEVDKVTGNVNIKPEFLKRVEVLNGLLTGTLRIVELLGTALAKELDVIVSVLSGIQSLYNKLPTMGTVHNHMDLSDWLTPGGYYQKMYSMSKEVSSNMQLGPSVDTQAIMDAREKTMGGSRNNPLLSSGLGPLKDTTSVINQLNSEMSLVGANVDPATKAFEQMEIGLTKTIYAANKVAYSMDEINRAMKEAGYRSVNTNEFQNAKDQLEGLNLKLKLAQEGVPKDEQSVQYDFVLKTLRAKEAISVLEKLSVNAHRELSKEQQELLSNYRKSLDTFAQERDIKLKINQLNKDNSAKPLDLRKDFEAFERNYDNMISKMKELQFTYQQTLSNSIGDFRAANQAEADKFVERGRQAFANDLKKLNSEIEGMEAKISKASVAGNESFIDLSGPQLSLKGINREYDAMIEKIATAKGLNADLAKALVYAESGGNPNAVSSAGARGLTQLMPGTAKDMGVKDITDPMQQLDGGLRYLAEVMAKANNDIPKALNMYHDGPGYGGVARNNAESQKYVSRVTSYQSALAGTAVDGGGSSQPIIDLKAMNSLTAELKQKRDAMLGTESTHTSLLKAQADLTAKMKNDASENRRQRELAGIKLEYANITDNVNEQLELQLQLLDIEAARLKLGHDQNSEYAQMVDKLTNMKKASASALGGDDFFAGFAEGAKDTTSSIQTMGRLGSEVAKDLKSGFKDVFKGLMTGADDMETRVANALDKMADKFLDFALDGFWDIIMNNLKGIGGGSGGGLSGIFSSALSGIGSLFGGGASGVASGGFDYGFTPAAGLSLLASGGIVDRPTQAWVGEGGMSEAIVPLPNGRSIPVDMRGGGTRQAAQEVNMPTPVVNVYKAGKDTSVQLRWVESSGQKREKAVRMVDKARRDV